MKAFILAAGVGSRLKPWTDSHPKALVPVGGVPMLERVVDRLHAEGIEDITINVHHFADQIINFVREKGWTVNISDERGELLETGGALLHARRFLCADDEPILVHNADILSNADFESLRQEHLMKDQYATLLISERESTRRLVFDREMELKGWHSSVSGEYKPSGFQPAIEDREYAFSGIYMISPKMICDMEEKGFAGRFPVMDYFLSTLGKGRFGGYVQENLELIDIGKPDSLNRAQMLFK